MLYHVSRRTDIPGCYWEWFLRRLDAGYVTVRNPHYPEKASRYSLEPDVCDGFCFLSKNYAPALKGIEGLMSLDDIVEKYKICTFDCTLTPYVALEPGLPKFKERYATIAELSKRYGRSRIGWFLAPMLVVEDLYSANYTVETLKTIVPRMAEICDRCMPDEVNLYDRVAKRSKRMRNFTDTERDEVWGTLGDLCKEHGISLRKCPIHALAYQKYGVEGVPCVSREELSDRCGVTIRRGGRERCGCVTMRDLGAYAPCPHGCAYCYAHPGKPSNYDPKAETLCQSLDGVEITYTPKQISLCH